MTITRRREWSIVLITWWIGALVFHRQIWTSGFDKLGGDNGDQRLAVVLHEHWLKVFSGDASWLTPNFFHPVSDTLGYSDTFVLDLVFYAPLRLLGLSPMMALQFTTILLGLVGFVGMYLVCRRLVSAPLPVALTAAWLVAFANNLFLHTGHQQLFAVNWVPWCILLAAKALRAQSRREALIWASGCGFLVGTLLYSSYYVGWFTVFTAGLVGGMYLLHRRQPMRLSVRNLWPRAVAFAVGLAVPMVPFALTYLPKLDETGGRRLKNVVNGLPDARDLIHHGRGNIWHETMVLIAGKPTRGHGSEQSMALTPVLMLTVFACGVLLRCYARHDRSPRVVLARALVASSVVLTVLPIRFGDTSLWRGVWTVVPGARALRAVDRIQLLNDVVAALAISLTAAIVHARLQATGRQIGRRALIAISCLLFVLVGEQLNTVPQARIDRARESARVAGVPTPPAECDSFIIAPIRDRPHYAVSIDAMWIAQSTGLPTLNGYSGAAPPLWDLDPTNSRYLAFAARWANRQGLSNVCLYDSDVRRWETGALDGIAVR